MTGLTPFFKLLTKKCKSFTILFIPIIRNYPTTMTDKAPEIRKLAREEKIQYTIHAIEEAKKDNFTTLQVGTMLKNCQQNRGKGDQNGIRVEGRAPATDRTGMVDICAHVKLIPNGSSNKILVITVFKG